MALYNMSEVLVRMLFQDAYVQKKRLVCECEECKDDILAITLNHLPARYVSTDQGNMYVKAEYFDHQLQSDVLRELAKAASIVGNNPRHAAPTANLSYQSGAAQRSGVYRNCL